MRCVNKLISSQFMNEDFPFWITRTIHSSIQEHSHEFIELVYVVGGNGMHCFEGTLYEIKAGDVFIINPGETHSYALEAGDKIEIINCLFMPSFIPDTLLRELEITGSMDYFYVHPFLSDDIRFNHRLNVSGREAAHVLALLEDMIREIGSAGMGHKTIIRLKLIELLVLLSRYYNHMGMQQKVLPLRKQESQMTARRIHGYMERNYDKKISLQSLSELFNISTRQLNRLVRREYGRSVIEILHDIRIGRARHLLLDTEEKVIAIAAMVGYDDPSFFSRLFQRLTGCSPSQYRVEGQNGGASREYIG